VTDSNRAALHRLRTDMYGSWFTGLRGPPGPMRLRGRPLANPGPQAWSAFTPSTGLSWPTVVPKTNDRRKPRQMFELNDVLRIAGSSTVSLTPPPLRSSGISGMFSEPDAPDP
jgi:hypothetical protein